MRLGWALVIALCTFPAHGAVDEQATQTVDRKSDELYAAQREAADRGSVSALQWCLQHGSAKQQSPRIEREMYGALIESASQGEGSVELGLSVLQLLRAEGDGIGRVSAASLCARLRESTPARTVRSASLFLEAQLLSPQDGKAGKQRVRARGLLSELIDDYPKSMELRRARDARWRLDHLSIGCVAPDFMTHDVDGNELRIKDYRDRVTVVRFLDFRDAESGQLVERDVHMSDRFWDERFALVGIGRDLSSTHFRRAREEWGVTWDLGFETLAAPKASRAWRVMDWPQTVVLDANGVVRALGLEGVALEAQVAALIREQNAVQAQDDAGNKILDGRREGRR